MKKVLPLAHVILTFLLFSLSSFTHAEDGYNLWLRYETLNQASSAALKPYAKSLIVGEPSSDTVQLAQQEMQLGLTSLFSQTLALNSELEDGAIILKTAAQLESPLTVSTADLEKIGSEGFIIRSLDIQDNTLILVTANEDIGLLYGAFELLRLFQTASSLDNLNIISKPEINLRLLNHWDNLDRTVERGYAGQSIWDWWKLPTVTDQRYKDYGRANASIGINGTVLNSVNSKSLSLTTDYIAKAAAIADELRPYGLKVYLSARFSSPLELGNLANADPLNPQVQEWWNAKVADIYQAIPDFGGFLVKANSEGQPGPQDYGRTHADGANMLATALQPYGGVVMWRAFVYSEINPEDRAKQAYSEFKPLDGLFKDNVIIQVKNGPIDFQPREPFHPMFGAFPNTPLMMEFQITKEYLGFASHLAYLGPLYEEVLAADTFAAGSGSTVATVINGSLHNYSQTGIAGVANIGTDRDWTGSDFNQANWYVFGKLAWDSSLSSDAIAQDWLAMTFSSNPEFIEVASDIMMRSREAVVNYMTPLGLTHLMATGHHYGPGPWVAELARPEWNPAYYHRADKDGIGFDRTATGSDALAQYFTQAAEQFSDPQTTEDEFLLWFHHLPWEYPINSSQTLWQSLIAHYDHGVEEVEEMSKQWATLEAFIDAERFTKTSQLLQVQFEEALWWRDASIAYFVSVSGLDLPDGVKAPEHSLEYYKAIEFPYAPGR